MKHYDCKYYLPTDVFKGICKRDKSKIQADEKACDHFQKIAKCKHCGHFSHGESEMGLCMKKSVAYPEMIAKTCHDFSWN